MSTHKFGTVADEYASLVNLIAGVNLLLHRFDVATDNGIIKAEDDMNEVIARKGIFAEMEIPHMGIHQLLGLSIIAATLDETPNQPNPMDAYNDIRENFTGKPSIMEALGSQRESLLPFIPILAPDCFRKLAGLVNEANANLDGNSSAFDVVRINGIWDLLKAFHVFNR